jgi:hypothetical protein
MFKFIAIIAFLATIPLTGALELINGTFQAWDHGRQSPAGWKNQTSAISSVEPADDGGAKIEITAAYRLHSALVQGRAVTGNAGWLRFTAHIVADLPDMAYLEVKLFKNNRRLKRLASGFNPGRPAMASLDFNTADADRIELACRLAADTKFLGKSAVFRNLRLVPGRDPERTIPFKTGEIRPDEFTNCSPTTTVEMSAKTLSIQVDKPDRFHSAVRLQLDSIPPSQDFHFAADAISNRSMNGYISAKLFRNGREIGRKESTSASPQKKRLFIDFNTGNADLIVLLCRVRQNRDDIGTQVQFEKLRIGEGNYQPADVSVQAKLECVPRYENCSVYINRCQAKNSRTFSGQVQYRKSGSERWLAAPPLVYIPDEKAARSSILKLDENTAYDVQIILDDAGRRETITGGFRTLHSQLPVAKTIVLGPDNFRGRLTPTESGSPDGYIRYTAQPGFVLDGSGDGEDVIHLENLHHLILDGLIVRGGKRFGITVAGSENIAIRNCDIARFGRTGTPDLSIGYKYCVDGEALRDIAGIRIVDSGKLLIERNYIHDTLGKTCPWFYSHPDGPFGILLQSTGGITLRYNDIIGSDRFRWNDVIGGYYNDSAFGSFYRDASIYGNFLAFANDDGIELDGGQMNCRFYQNRVEGTLCGVSTAPCLLGPVYIFENLFCNPGDEFQVANVALKNNFGSFGKGQLQYFNNTACGNWSGYSGYYSIPVKLSHPNELKALTRNNIFAITGEFYDPGAFVLPNDFDFNLFWNPSNPPTALIASALSQALSTGNDSQSLTNDPKFVDPASGDFRLSPDSPAVGAGSPVRGLFEEKPDIGALQSGGLQQLPYRPTDLETSQAHLAFTWPDTTQTIRVGVSGKHDVTFAVRQPENNDFFSVTPATGVAKPHQPAELRITLHPENMPDAKVYSGAFLIRDSQGYTRPISVRADFRGDTANVKKRRQTVVYGTVSPQDKDGKCIVEFDLPKSGDYFLFGFMSRTSTYALMRRIEGGGVFRRTRFYGVVGDKQPAWHAISVNLYTRNPYLPTTFPKGRSSFEIMPRQGAPYKIERIALAPSPEAMLDSPLVE